MANFGASEAWSNDIRNGWKLLSSHILAQNPPFEFEAWFQKKLGWPIAQLWYRFPKKWRNSKKSQNSKKKIKFRKFSKTVKKIFKIEKNLIKIFKNPNNFLKDQNKAINDATMNQKAKITFFFYRNQPIT